MPRVVVELQANTQDAVQKIQQFARAQKDAFDAVRATTPALADASVKVSKLTEVTGTAASATNQFNQAAKNLAQGGMRELAGQVPIVGNALTQLAGTLKGFPAIALTVVAAGVSIIKMLSDMSAEASKTIAQMEKVGQAMQASSLAADLATRGRRATAAGDVAGGLDLAAQADIQRAAQERDAAIAASKEAAAAAQPGMFSKESIGDFLLGPFGGLKAAKQAMIAAEQRQKEHEAIAAFAYKEFEIKDKLNQDLLKLEETYDEKIAENLAKREEAVVESAEKQKVVATEVVTHTVEAVAAATSSFREMYAELDALAAQSAASARAELAGIDAQVAAMNAPRMRPVPGPGELRGGVEFYGPTMTDLQLQQEISTRTALQNRATTVTNLAIQDLESFQHGGVVPGTGPVPIMAHGGETILPTRSGGGGGGAIRIEPGAIQISGTVIDQSRSWGVLVEELGQALEARLRGRR